MAPIACQSGWRSHKRPFGRYRSLWRKTLSLEDSCSRCTPRVTTNLGHPRARLESGNSLTYGESVGVAPIACQSGWRSHKRPFGRYCSLWRKTISLEDSCSRCTPRVTSNLGRPRVRRESGNSLTYGESVGVAPIACQSGWRSHKRPFGRYRSLWRKTISLEDSCSRCTPRVTSNLGRPRVRRESGNSLTYGESDLCGSQRTRFDASSEAWRG
ncbi:hypothetical protein Pan216_39390 [Planctomycetes bacterium Pan216]|uniref:Uncharacterized protein n=1 Tax=Kolteria novifilia TaxID=2527975 RepID=A0A518B7V1_9BACT|nr:hypothetical protein Pan216_39390 [Planctomycetes bacterium Pan216]